MPRQLKISALTTFVLAFLFFLFFQNSKDIPELAQVNAFAEDPYDAVGSFAIQFALFAALLSFLRAFRLYKTGQVPENEQLLSMRAAYLSCLSIAVTLVADAVAMVRHPAMWVGRPTGLVLVALLGGMALLTALTGWLVYHSTRGISPMSSQSAWTRAIVLSAVGILILVLYPEGWRESVVGELFTILVGILLLFVPVRAWGDALCPDVNAYFEDFIDFATAFYRVLKGLSGPFVVLFNTIEKIRDLAFVRPVLSWLNPRRHPWSISIFLGIFTGGLLALVEIMHEGAPQRSSQLAMVASIYIGVETTGVLLGYLFFAKPLGLFRQETDSQPSGRM